MRRPSEIREKLDNVKAARMNGGMGDTGLRVRQDTLEWVLEGVSLTADARLRDAVTDLFWESLGDELAAAAETYDTDKLLKRATAEVRAAIDLAEDDLKDQVEKQGNVVFCGACGGSGGGPDAHLRCPYCAGRGQP